MDQVFLVSNQGIDNLHKRRIQQGIVCSSSSDRVPGYNISRGGGGGNNTRKQQVERH